MNNLDKLRKAVNYIKKIWKETNTDSKIDNGFDIKIGNTKSKNIKRDDRAAIYIYVDNKNDVCLKVGQAKDTHLDRITNHYNYNERVNSRLANSLNDDSYLGNHFNKSKDLINDWMKHNLDLYVLYIDYRLIEKDNEKAIVLNFVEGMVQQFLKPLYEK